MPACEEIGDAGAQQPRAVDGVLDAHRGHRAQVRQKIRSVMTGEARRLAAAEAQRAGCAVLARQRHQRGALEILARPETADGDPRPTKGPSQGLCSAANCGARPTNESTKKICLNSSGPIAAGQQQMPDLVLRIEQHHADGIERIGFAQAVHHGAQQLRQAVGPQQRQFARLRALQDGLVVGGLRRHFLEALLELFDSPDQVIHVRIPIARQPARAGARTSKYARPRFMIALNSAEFPVFTAATRRSTACCKASSDSPP